MRDYMTADERLGRVPAAVREELLLNIASSFGIVLVMILSATLVIYHTFLR